MIYNACVKFQSLFYFSIRIIKKERYTTFFNKIGIVLPYELFNHEVNH